MRIYTCTPVSFKGDRSFFFRDSGLLSRGLQSVGVDSKAIMPLPAHAEDEEHLLRARRKDLEDPQWWSTHRADAVVLFAWAMPQYTPIARAIKSSGAKLMLYLDAAGIWSPWSDGFSWFLSYWNFNTRTYGRAMGIPRFLLGTLRQSVPRLFSIPRLEQLTLADVIGTGSPSAMQRTINYARTFGFANIAYRIVLSPPAIPEHFSYQGERKRKRVICVARWLPRDWAQKNPKLLLLSLASFLGRRRDYEAVVVGRGASNLRYTKFHPKQLNHLPIKFIDAIPNTELTTLYKESRISFCSSYHESFHLASFEAACCGCSVVALDSHDVPALQWLASSDGTLAAAETPTSCSDSLNEEAEAWEAGKRDPFLTSQKWCSLLHASKGASRVVEQLGLCSSLR